MLYLNPRLQYEPERVVSIVSSSRSGSTIFKYALCLHPDLCHLAGEEEPYYKFAKNGYPWHMSDEFHSLHNESLVRECIANELHNYHSETNRHLLRANRIEEPPFVNAIECRRTPTLVLKTPQNCYRRGVIEQLYPNAEIINIVMKRDPRAIVNGLLDGWGSPDFTARETPAGWWKFDMPPGWSWERDLIKRCIHQWQTSWRYIDIDYAGARTVWFEEFERDWKGLIEMIWWSLDLPQHDISDVALPELMTTVPPMKERWKIQRPWLEEKLRKHGW